MKSFIPFILVLNLLLVACATSSETAAEKASTTPSNVYRDPGISQRYDSENCVIKTYDLSGDLVIDLWKVYQTEQEFADVEQTKIRLLRKEMDNNADGVQDQWLIYDLDEKLIREEFDSTFSGYIDHIVYYEKGVKIRTESYQPDQIPLTRLHSEIQAKPNNIKYYKNNTLSKVEKDTDGNGKIDTWEVYNPQGEIIQIGKDFDHDGIIDNWDHF